MTNFSDNTSRESRQKVPLIPPASIRTSRSSSNSFPAQRNTSEIKQSNSVCYLEQNNLENMKNVNKAKSSMFGPESWSSVEDLFWDHMKEVQNKWSTLKLNDDIWAKLIYFERNRRLAKAYVSAPVLTVDGSTHGLDGFRIGLSGIDNMYRSLDSIGCLRSISQGIKLKIDNKGNILIRKIGQQSLANNAPVQCSIWVKDWPSTSNSKPNAPLNENCMMREIERSDISYKLFDMRKFRLQLEKLRLNNDNNNIMDWRQCVSIISFVRATKLDDQKQAPTPTNLLEDPCWLMIINIIAIDMLKSTICDRNSPTRQGSTSLIQNHSLLESRNNLFRNNSNSNNNSILQKAPLRNSSSASILFPSTTSSTTTTSNQVNKGDGDQSVNNINSLASTDRVKKLRTTNSRYRSSPVKSGPPQYRRYQSTLQLSSAASNNNTIYTTFNSKFINSKSYTDNSSTSDYNSASRSTSSGHNYWCPPQQPFYPMDSLQQRIPSRLRHREEGRALVARKSFMPPLETIDKSLSLSAFDLSQRRIDLRSIKSSIKMNYDHLSETEDSTFDQVPPVDDYKSLLKGGSQQQMHGKQNFESTVINRQTDLPMNGHAISHPKLATKSEPKKTSESTSCCCEHLAEKAKDGSQSSHLNHNHILEHGCGGRSLQGGKVLTEVDDKDRQQKVSKSSIASSSSSSGCVDNDYFMSHSSSSMSSSTASNERELFSQPASSSGIVCSGSTSDEYDDNQRKQATKGKSSGGGGIGSSSSKLSDSVGKISKCGITTTDNHHSLQSASTTQIHRRGYKIKTIDPSSFCCELASSRHHHNGTTEFGCDCPPVELECDCCCDCFQPEPTAIDLPSTTGSCRCDDDESIYSRLPHPSQAATTAPAATAAAVSNLKAPKSTTKKYNATDAKKGNEIRGSGKVSTLRNDFKSISTTPSHSEKEKSTVTRLDEHSKQTSGWLERRKYSRILPKFIFSSTSSNSRQVVQENKSTQRKSSNTLDEKFRLTRSTQNLS